MLVSTPPPLHLTYCLNIHPGESWAENFQAIRDHALRVREAVRPGERFGLGLRLSHRAAGELLAAGALADLRAFLDDHDLYAFTINGFPYGPFHGTAVKEDVYRPDWRTTERRDYTLGLIDILAALLPEGVPGSISTVPGAYKPWIRSDEDVQQMVRILTEAADHAKAVRDRTGRDITIALEPEPDCFIETTDEAIAFFTEALGADDATRRHLSVCLDTAHAAVEFEDPAEALVKLSAAGVGVGKVQLSAALRLAPTEEALGQLGAFADPVYIHQVRLREPDGTEAAFADLPQALAEAGDRAPDAELRVHFHVPLFFEGAGGLASTGDLLTDGFWRRVAAADSAPTAHLEIETYTFGVLPERLRLPDVADSIAREYRWVLERLGRAQAAP